MFFEISMSLTRSFRFRRNSVSPSVLITHITEKSGKVVNWTRLRDAGFKSDTDSNTDLPVTRHPIHHGDNTLATWSVFYWVSGEERRKRVCIAVSYFHRYFESALLFVFHND